MSVKYLAIIPLLSSVLYAQPLGDPPPPRENGAQRQPAELDPNQSAESLKQRLEQTLLFAQRIVEKHEEAIAQLEAGQDPKEVMRSLRTHDLRVTGRMTRRDRSSTNDSPDRSQREPRQPRPAFDDKTLNDVRAFIADHLPSVDEQLSTIEQVSPRATQQLLDRLAPKILEIMSFEGDNSAMSSLKLDELRAGLQYVEAARQYRGLLRTGESDQEKIKAAEEAVRQAASARFDAQVHIKQYEIHQLTMRIEQLHDALEDLNAQREDQVQAQIYAARRTPGPRVDRNRDMMDSNPGED